ncbi:MAG TPA: hypothetical protein PKI19_10390 [Elusimicrobiales bacterium]|nr:hypothetical protein [Elusimicrobiales bacterium]
MKKYFLKNAPFIVFIAAALAPAAAAAYDQELSTGPVTVSADHGAGLLSAPGASTAAAQGQAALNGPGNILGTNTLSFYGADMTLPLEDRLGFIPDKVLELYRQMDGMQTYAAYTPGAEGKKLFMEYLRLMPQGMEKLFRERCAGLYFIKGLIGNGFTNWAADKDGQLYFTMALNSAVLETSLSETLSARESSCFIPEKGWSVAVDAGTKYKGLAYALFHEGAHAADYLAGFTPWVEPDLPAVIRRTGSLKAGFEKIWADYGKPREEYDYKFRDRLTFYGFGSGPRIAVKDAGQVYAGLATSPFISLYGSMSWAEDFAELAALGLITGELGQPYKITVSSGGVTQTELAPCSGEKTRRAAAALAALRERLPEN